MNDAINDWISKGFFKVNPIVVKSPGPICAACPFGKGHQKPNSAATGRISGSHKVQAPASVPTSWKLVHWGRFLGPSEQAMVPILQ
jgi:hypothetical protein